MSDGSVTRWIAAAKSGDDAAAGGLWQRYFEKMVSLARARLREGNRRMSDEEDAALSAFDSFLRGAESGRFPRLTDRDDLWRLLVVLTTRKAIDHVNRERAQKRGGGNVADETSLASDDEDGVLAHALSREPTPDDAAEMVGECRRLMLKLGDPELRLLALLKMEGYTDEEAGARLGCARITVQRMLRLIRDLWQEESGE